MRLLALLLHPHLNLVLGSRVRDSSSSRPDGNEREGTRTTRRVFVKGVDKGGSASNWLNRDVSVSGGDERCHDSWDARKRGVEQDAILTDANAFRGKTRSQKDIP